MNKPVTQLRPYLVLEPQPFEFHLRQLLRVIGAPQDTPWQQQPDEVRQGMERINPAVLARFLSNRSTADAIEMAYVFAVVSLVVKFPLARAFRGWIAAELKLEREQRMNGYPFARKNAYVEEINKVLDVLRASTAEPEVQADLTPPELPPLEPMSD